MDNVRCEHCGRELPLNETLTIQDKHICKSCSDNYYSEQEGDQADAVQPQIDPNICFNCQKDNGSEPLPLLANLPICDQCAELYRNRPFPLWVKAFFAAVLALVIFSCIWNARFMRGYFAMNNAFEAFDVSEFEKAASLMQYASQDIPESADLQTLNCYFQGINYLHQDRSKEALALFQKCGSQLPPDYNLDFLILSAQIGVAFDEKDYDTFLKLALKMKNMNPQDQFSLGMVSSAYACKYAETGSEEYKTQALTNLEDAKKMAPENPDFLDYQQRILYRLHSREIITNDEFHKRFPNGWSQPEKEQ